MTEVVGPEIPRLLTKEQMDNLYQDILATAFAERPTAINANLQDVKVLIANGIHLIERLEETTHQTRPEVHTDTDVIYIDSGPGPYSYQMLEPGKTDLDDKSYHGWKWSRKMDRARIRVSYTLAAMVTAKRIEEQTKTVKPPKDLTSEDFEKFGPYLMYASVDWQQRHIEYVLGLARQRERAQFLIPASKIITYKEYINREGEEKPIVNTDDQVEGLHFPPFNETHPPKRIVMVSHPAHLMRILHILGKYPDSIPQETTLQLFPIPTPKDAVTEYAKAEILGTLGTIFRRGRATFVPYANYEL